MIYTGDCLDVLKTLPADSVDAIVTDPPYGLAFMGKKWDYDVPSEEIWRECLRVLKPGGHLLAFAGTRTQHRMAVRIEDAGFEIRDMIAWVYGSGFPKSLDVSKAIDKAAGAEREVIGPATVGGKGQGNAYGTITRPPATAPATAWQGWGTALKPALEPITVARKPLIGTVAENVLAHGTGALNVDGCRVGTEGATKRGGQAEYPRNDNGTEDRSVCWARTGHAIESVPLGRWPANLIHDGSEEVVGLFPQTGPSPKQYEKTKAGWLAPGSLHIKSGLQSREYGDSGSAARFFKRCENDYNEAWQSQNPPQLNALAVAQGLSLQGVLASIVQNAVAIWPTLAGILSSEQREVFTAVTLNESKAINETVMQTIASIANGFLQESQHERLTPCGSRVRSVATQNQTGTTKITTSLYRFNGNAESATFSITPNNLVRGEAVYRFNYCAKASKADRDEGCDKLQERSAGECVDRVEGSAGMESPRAGAGRTSGSRNHHPTVKPTALMRYLCRLVTPPGGIVLDPFMGSGSTGKAAMLEGFDFIGIERDPEYVKIAEARISAACRLL